MEKENANKWGTEWRKNGSESCREKVDNKQARGWHLNAKTQNMEMNREKLRKEILVQSHNCTPEFQYLQFMTEIRRILDTQKTAGSQERTVTLW